MAMDIPTIKVPGWLNPINAAFGYITRVDLATLPTGVSAVHVGVFASAASDAAGEPPLKVITFTPNQVMAQAVNTPAVYGDPVLITPAVYGDPPVISEGPPAVYGPAPLITEAVYGPPPLITPAVNTPAVIFPSLAKLMQHADFAAAFNVMRTYLYNSVSAYSEFAGSTQV